MEETKSFRWDVFSRSAKRLRRCDWRGRQGLPSGWSFRVSRSWEGARGAFRMEFQEQKFTKARVVSEAVSSVRSTRFSGQYYRIKSSIGGLE